jgi:hypothetical protein
VLTYRFQFSIYVIMRHGGECAGRSYRNAIDLVTRELGRSCHAGCGGVTAGAGGARAALVVPGARPCARVFLVARDFRCHHEEDPAQMENPAR